MTTDRPSPHGQALHLERRDASRNMARFYLLSVERSLFGDAVLVREWGRIGTRGQRRLDLYEHEEHAREALARLAASKRGRGYWPAG